MVVSARHRWPEQSGFCIDRPAGLDTYTFLHFFNSVELTVGGETVHTRPNACLLYRYGTPQWFRSADPLLHDWMHLRPEAEKWVADYGVPVDRIFYPEDVSFVTAGICEIELELVGNRPYRADMAAAAARMLLIRLGRACSAENDGLRVAPELREQLFAFRSSLMARMGEPWTVARMAREMRMSVPRLYVCYRGLFGVPPMDDLIRARIDAAKNALTSGGISITRLADSLGYANVTHFSRQFRQHTGVSPRDFARKYRGTGR